MSAKPKSSGTSSSGDSLPVMDKINNNSKTTPDSRQSQSHFVAATTQLPTPHKGQRCLQPDSDEGESEDDLVSTREKRVRIFSPSISLTVHLPTHTNTEQRTTGTFCPSTPIHNHKGKEHVSVTPTLSSCLLLLPHRRNTEQ